MREKFRQLALAWGQLRQVDSRFLPLVLVGASVGLLVGAGIGAVVSVWAIGPLSLVFGLMGTMMVFGRRARKAQYEALEGRPGAAAAMLEQMRGQWFVSPAVAINAKQDMVHRVVGRPGIVLVGEGAPQRVKGLLAKERKRLSKMAGDVPVTTVLVGDGDRGDQVPLNKLQWKLSKMKGALRKTEVPKLERRLRPLDKAPPVPKGIDPMAVANRKRPKPR